MKYEELTPYIGDCIDRGDSDAAMTALLNYCRDERPTKEDILHGIVAMHLHGTVEELYMDGRVECGDNTMRAGIEYFKDLFAKTLRGLLLTRHTCFPQKRQKNFSRRQ